MAQIQINAKYRARSDEHQWVLERFVGMFAKGKKAGEENWVPEGYFARLSALASAVYEKGLRDSAAKTVEELAAAGKRLESDVRAALEPGFEAIGEKAQGEVSDE